MISGLYSIKAVMATDTPCPDLPRWPLLHRPLWWGDPEREDGGQVSSMGHRKMFFIFKHFFLKTYHAFIARRVKQRYTKLTNAGEGRGAVITHPAPQRKPQPLLWRGTPSIERLLGPSHHGIVQCHVTDSSPTPGFQRARCAAALWFPQPPPVVGHGDRPHLYPSGEGRGAARAAALPGGHPRLLRGRGSSRRRNAAS